MPPKQSELEKIWVLGQPTIQSPGIDVVYGEPIIEEMQDEPQMRERRAGRRVGVQIGPVSIRRAASSPWEKLMSRGIMTGLAGTQSIDPMIVPRAALTPRAQADLPPQAEFIDLTKLTPEENEWLPYVIDPLWLRRQMDPGTELSEEEKAKARAKAGVY